LIGSTQGRMSIKAAKALTLTANSVVNGAQQVILASQEGLLNAGVIVSRLAGINLSAQQNIDNQNELNAQTDVVITSQGNLTNTSTIQATHGDAILTVKGDVDNQQTIYSGQHLSMTTNGQLYNSGLLYGGETARFDVMQQLNNDGKILAAQ